MSGMRQFLSTRKRLLSLHLIGFAAINTMSYGQLAWTPELFRRAFGWTTGEIGVRYGLVFMIFGAAGAVAGGLTATHLRARGRTDANMLAMLAGALGLAISAPLAPLASSARLALALYGPTIFFFSFPSGVSLSALVDVTPGHLRGRMIALYYVVISMTGLMIGPSLVSQIEHEMGTHALGRPLAWDAILLAPIAVLCFAANLRPYRRAIAALGEHDR
jgi:MFS family permease